MNIEIVYPKLNAQFLSMQKFRKAAELVFVISALTCVIVNICVGGKPWSAIVIGGLWLTWAVLFARSLVDNHIVGRATKIFFFIGMYLFIVDWTVGNGWSFFVVPIVLFGLLILLSLIFFLGFAHQKRNLMPFFWLVLVSLGAMTCAILGFSEMNWPTIVLGSIAFAIFATCIIGYRKPLAFEIKKRFHI